MATKRMYSPKIVESDAFLDMPASTQNLYFHLGLHADDDGFINNPRMVMRMVGASDDDMKILIAKGFLILFDDGVILQKHWKINNYIRSDRYVPTKCTDNAHLVHIKDNGAYTLRSVGKPLIPTDPDDLHIGIPEVSLKKSKEKKDIVQIEEFFEMLWKRYPSKKGKGRISITQKTKLFKIGEEEMIRAIDRYVKDLKKDEWRKPQNGSTFFNSGYIDYLDANYSGTETAEAKHENTFAQLSDI